MLDIDRATPGLGRLLSADAPLDRIYHGMTFGEGPVWNRRDGTLLWVDIVGDTIYRWQPGIADGMKVDTEGNVYCTGPAGIHVISPDGALRGRIRLADHVTNMAWGDADWCSLYITTYHSVFRTRVNVPGVAVW